jgi:hypothetical protein
MIRVEEDPGILPISIPLKNREFNSRSIDAPGSSYITILTFSETTSME